VEYTKHFKDDGITDDEINAMLDEVENDMNKLEESATSTTKEEIENIRWLLEAAHKMVRSTYRTVYGEEEN
jgi:archaellum component FlaC